MTSVSRSTRGAAVAGAGLVLALLTAVTGCGPASGADTGTGEAPVLTVTPENVAVVERRELRSGPAISGTLEPERQAMLRAEIGGAVTAVQAEAGQTVRAGELLVRLDDIAIREAARSAESAVRVGREQADQARRNLARAERLAAAGAVSEQAVEQARAGLLAAEAGLADAESRLSAARQQVERAAIRAPFAGVVSARPISLGDVVQPGALLVTVVDPASMRLEAAVPLAALSTIRTGTRIDFTVPGYPDRVFIGTVDRVNPTVDPATRQVRIGARIPNTGGALVAGLFAEGRVAIATSTGLVVPFAALDQRGVAPVLLVLRGGRTVSVTPRVGLRDETLELVEILEGLMPGDSVLLGSARGIAPGTAVRVGRDR